MRVVALNELISDMHRLLRRLIREDILLDTLPGPNLWPVRIDSGQIEQVIVNLAINACDSMPAGGRLTIETRNVMIAEGDVLTHLAVPPGPYVLLSIADSGVGMDEEVQRHAFEPFFTTKEHGRGTGLGLATCYGIIAQHGGGISLHSELGRGTSVQLYLPRAAGPAAEPPAPSSAALPRGCETVLLVEDDAPVRDLVARVLRAQGYKVLEMPNAAGALQLAAQLDELGVRLLLTDVVMPDMSGRSLADLLTARLPGLRVLFISGYAEQLGRLGPGTAYLPKPFTPAELAHRVRTILDAS